MPDISLACYFSKFDKYDVISHLHTVTGRNLIGQFFSKLIAITHLKAYNCCFENNPDVRFLLALVQWCVARPFIIYFLIAANGSRD